MANLAIQKVTLTGLEPMYVAAAVGGDTFTNNGKVTFNVKNGDIAPVTITINSATACNYGFDHNIAIVVPAGGAVTVGPFQQGRFNNPANNGLVDVTYSGVTLLTVAAITT